MFIFRVQGFAGSPGSYFSDSPIDVTVFAENEDEAIGKVEAASGRKLSGIERKIVAKEVAPTTTTTEAVPVVRCGECERRNKSADLTDTVYCRWLKLQMEKTDFCSYGERR